jgi:hypothetical protein
MKTVELTKRQAAAAAFARRVLQLSTNEELAEHFAGMVEQLRCECIDELIDASNDYYASEGDHPHPRDFYYLDLAAAIDALEDALFAEPDTEPKMRRTDFIMRATGKVAGKLDAIGTMLAVYETATAATDEIALRRGMLLELSGLRQIGLDAARELKRLYNVTA